MISRPWQMFVALAEVAQGFVTLVTFTAWRPEWALHARMAGMLAALTPRPRTRLGVRRSAR